MYCVLSSHCSVAACARGLQCLQHAVACAGHFVPHDVHGCVGNPVSWRHLRMPATAVCMISHHDQLVVDIFVRELVHVCDVDCN